MCGQRNGFSTFVLIQLSRVSGLGTGRIPGLTPSGLSSVAVFGRRGVVIVISRVITQVASCCDWWLSWWWWWWRHLACFAVSLEEFESLPLCLEKFFFLGKESCCRWPPLSRRNLGKSFRYLCSGTHGLGPSCPQVGSYFSSGLFQRARVSQRSVDLGF